MKPFDPIRPPRLPAVPELQNLAVGGSFFLNSAQIQNERRNGTEFKQCEIDQSRFDRVELSSCRFKTALIADTTFDECLLFGSNFDNSHLKRVSITGGMHTGIILSGAKMEDITFRNCKLNLSNFRLSQLKRITFIDCELSDADFGTSQLSQVTFDSCVMTGADFSSCEILSADLRDSDISLIKGISGLKGATVNLTQAIGLAQTMAIELGLNIVTAT